MLLGLCEKLVKGFMKILFRVELRGEENIPETGGCMVCVNHISMWDPVLLNCFMPRHIGFMAKAELRRVPLVGTVLKGYNTVFVKRDTSDIGAIKSCINALNQGCVLGIFPTGTREKFHPGAKPKPGAAFIASKAGATVIPVGINATYKLFSKVTVTIGEPMDYSSVKGKKTSSEELREITDKIYGKILEIKS